MPEGKAPTQPRLSSLIRDPFVRAAFERAERDAGATPVEPPRQNKPLQGGAAAKLPSEGRQIRNLNWFIPPIIPFPAGA